jgi:predicted phage tail protein
VCPEDPSLLGFNPVNKYVRFGAADYWTERGKLDHTIVFRKIEQYCHNSMWTIRSLKVPSGSLTQLLSEAESSIVERKNLESFVESLKNQVREMRSQEHRAIKVTIVSAAKFLFNSTVLTGSFIAVSTFAHVGVWASLSVIGVIALFFLFLEGKLSEALFKSKTGSVTIKAK